LFTQPYNVQPALGRYV